MSGMVARARAAGEPVSTQEFCLAHSACRPIANGSQCDSLVGTDSTPCPEPAEWLVVEESSQAFLWLCTACAIHVLADTDEGQELLHGTEPAVTVSY